MKKNTRKLIAVMLGILMCVAMLPLAVSAEETVEIATAEDLTAFAIAVNAGEKCDAEVILTADIEADDSFTPIGTTEHPFTGTFNGNGFTLTADVVADGYAGLFGVTDKATLTDIEITSGAFEAAAEEGISEYAGAVVAYATDTEITGCTSGAAVYADTYTGGIIGYGEGCEITECSTLSSAYIGGYEEYCGGIAGALVESTVSGCVNNAYIAGVSYVGGIAGSAKKGDFVDCVSTGTVNADTEAAGGIAGIISGTNIGCSYNTGKVYAAVAAAGVAAYATEAAVSNCYNSGAVSADDSYCAGLVAVLSDSEMNNCYNSGAVYASSGSSFAGIFSMLNGGTVENCYNVGTVTGNCKTYAGIGSSVSGTVTNCYSVDTATVSFRTASDAEITGCARLSAEKMTAAEAFEGFDFESDWEMDDGHGYEYPVLTTINYHTLSYISTTAPNCTMDGFDVNLCTVCGRTVENNYVDALGHSWTTLSEKKATCTESGYADLECEVCGETDSQEFEALGHIDSDGDNKCDECGAKMTEDENGGEKVSLLTKISQFFKNFFAWIKSLFTK